MATRRIAWTTGEQTVNQTVTRAGVGGTDLGILWDDGAGGVLSIWGDTFLDSPEQGSRWRSNVLARSSNTDVAQRGVVLDWWAADPAEPGFAREVVHRDGPADFTVIPTGGLAVGSRQYVTYMAIEKWGEPGRWTTNYAGFAWSDDGGTSWTKDPRARWDNTPARDQGWQMCALADGGDDHVYVFGTPNGRAGDARLARVPAGSVLDLAAHRRWDGSDWSDAVDAGAVVIPAPVSELSVARHGPSGRWLAAYYHEDLDGVVVRAAPEPVGPWSEPVVVASAQDYPHLYGCFWHPWTMDDDAPCASVSQWPPYQTQILEIDLGELTR